MKAKTFFVLLLAVLFAAAGVYAGGQEIPVTTSSTDAMHLFHEGQGLLDVGRQVEAKALFEKAVVKDPDFSYAYLEISNSAVSPEEFKESLDLAMKNLDGKSEGEKILVEMNRTFLTNDATRRIELAEKLVHLYPESARAWLNLGNMQATLNLNDGSRKSMQKSLELNPGFMAAHFALGNSYLFGDPKDLRMAMEQMDRCVELSPKEAKAYEGQGDVFRAMNQLDSARQAYTMAIEVDPTLGEAHLKKGHIDSFLGKFDEARADYDRGISSAKDSNRITFANYRAFTYVHAGNAKQALMELDKIVAMANAMKLPEDQISGAKYFTLTNELTIAMHHKMFDQAKTILGQLRTVSDNMSKTVANADFKRQQDATILQWEGLLAARMGDYKTAQAKAEESRKLVENDRNPRRFEGYQNLIGLTFLLEGDYTQAVEHLRKADLTTMYTKYYLGLALDGAGQKTEARKLFQEVADWNFNSVGYALVRKDAISRIS